MVNSGFNIQIPTCVQLEKGKNTKIENDDYSDDEINMKKTKKEQTLTTAQTGETRLVTKVLIVI